MGEQESLEGWQVWGVTGEFLPDRVEGVVGVLGDWIAAHPGDGGAGGVRVLRDGSAVFVYWKGTVPDELRRLAEGQAVPVVFQAAKYSKDELAAAVHSVMVSNPGLSSAGILSDYSGIQVTLSSSAPPDTMAAVEASCHVPVVLRGIGDPRA